MPSITTADLSRMRATLFFDGEDAKRKQSRFWMLLVLASVIAAAGVIGDSTATVIGAMIVAPLMVPILGTVLAIMTGDRANLARSVLMVIGGATVAIFVGWLLGQLAPVDVNSTTSSQVASRVSPRLIDLLAALATGAVGGFAQCRDDIADTLPGVAIAISLVPPLTVVGLTLEAGAGGEATGALLLFLTNVAAILLAGCVIMGLHKVSSTAMAELPSTVNRNRAVVAVVVLVGLVAVPLAGATARFSYQNVTRTDVARVARQWASPEGWSIGSVEPLPEHVVVRALGPLPSPDPAELRAMLDAAGLDDIEVRLVMIPEDVVDLRTGN